VALNNITAGVREREDANRTREAGHLDEIQAVVANDEREDDCAFAFVSHEKSLKGSKLESGKQV
jgi:hypothetical protein